VSILRHFGDLTVLAVALAASLTLIGCTSGGGGERGTAPAAATPATVDSDRGEADATRTGASRDFVEEDVRFMQHMILHHAQALEMAALVPGRAEREEIHLLARRIEISQQEEIERMRRWLEVRDASTEPSPAADHDAHAGHAAHGALPTDSPGGMDGDPNTPMPGMLTQAELDRLAAASGEGFDRLFLELMIFHHEGAIQMVEDLFASPRGGQQSDVFDLASHVHSEQRMEIDRMRGWLGAPSTPPDH